jgi:predicted enzyme related to lactoylglutathione lyase
MEVTQHAPGTFCWAELTTTSSSTAKAFYEPIFGWVSEDSPVGPDMVYTMWKRNGRNACAMFETHDPAHPPHWSLYVTVEDADTAAARAAELGGTVIAAPFDVMEHGRMAVISDPTGAVFCIWQPKGHIGSQITEEPGTHSWNELMTTDLSAARAFYTGLFGWEADDSMGFYVMFKAGETYVGGMAGITPEMGPMPSSWSPYFLAEDTDKAVSMASAAGGTVLAGPEDVPGMVRFAMIQDPTGGVFGVFKPLSPQG